MSSRSRPEEYLGDVARVARWSEEHGCTGILVYTDNSLVDPWLVSQVILENTERLCPLVAVQPVYMHPYAVAKMVATYGLLYRRRIYLNMLAGGFKNDLVALGDTTPHDERYDRMREYTQVLRDLLRGGGPVSLAGEYYTVSNLKLTPPLPEELAPGIFVSGSSPAGFAAARALGATAVRYPKPPDEDGGAAQEGYADVGVRLGIIARESAEEAWRVAHERFPEDRQGQLTHALAMKVSDSHWHRQLSELGERPVSARNPYWLGPFRNYKTFCPYLVGDYERVARELSRYVALGYLTFILDIPPDGSELRHTRRAFEGAIRHATP
ncbi:MAG: LLM class flavin-dependent oxidoreductase [Planctomycetota bacterium]